jgi:predicted phosphoadenosine phosphosulfate sulfurtransferase
LMYGNSTTERAKEYISKWKARCYSDDIPDELPRKLQESGRAPSYRAIAEAVLKNDLMLNSIGGEKKDSKWFFVLHEDSKLKKSGQLKLL